MGFGEVKERVEDEFLGQNDEMSRSNFHDVVVRDSKAGFSEL